MMSRDDILRELELLPVWQLRHPVALEKTAEAIPTAELIEQESDVDQSQAPSQVFTFRLMASEDGQWLFALKSQQNEEAETLLQNMLKAVTVKIGQEMAEAQATIIADYKPKVIVAMGEDVAQQLLALNQPLAQLRGKAHGLKETSVIVTYAPDALLQNPADKANAWADLCLAKFTIANL